MAHSFLEWINDQTRWIYVVSVLGYFLVDPSIHTCYALTGAVVAAVIGKGMKKLINQSRPHKAQEKDPGMPSSHANCIAYLSLYPSLQMVITLAQPTFPPAAAPHRLLSLVSSAQPTSFITRTQWHYSVASFVLGAGVFFSWLRVRLHFHTAAQVIAGFCLGSSLAVLWFLCGEELLLPAAASCPWLDFLVRSLSLVCLVLFCEWYVMKWVRKHNKQAAL
eukprot:gb/GEZN01019227.1/.p1 GENE.gb/GEZN01019227.1/~~gb/GEZN01019227.1/.p1  ORF type:complete len:220 (-),score=18.91 gb/GEZN01019227.1/:45-704(-)